MLKYECESRCFNYPVKCRECKETSDIYNPDPCFLDRNSDLVKQIKSEAIKEFADLVDRDVEEMLSDSIKEQNPHLYLIHQIVKDRLKEMVGDCK